LVRQPHAAPGDALIAVARQTRSQRRARREAQQASGAAARAQRRPGQVRPSQQPVVSQTGRRRAPAEGARRFVSESWGELKKVEWPGQSQVIQGTVVVLIACLIVGTYLFAADQAFKPLVRYIIGQ
jgi:preprotein translocase subunit SecE